MKVSVNAPKTPVTKGSMGMAAATIPNVCKMPGPPAPFVPTPLPNIGKSDSSPKDYSKKVKVEGKPAAIKGATFKSLGDVASKGTGGGLVSANTHGPTSFVGPGSFDVKFEGKNVQLLGDPMLNNCGGSGNPANSATLAGVLQGPGLVAVYGDEDCPVCGQAHGDEVRLEESEDTQGLADQLASAADTAVTKAQAAADARYATAQLEAAAAHAETLASLEALAAEGSLDRRNNRLMKKLRKGYKPGQKPRMGFTQMLGVVKCKHGKVFAGFSYTQYTDVQAEMPGGWHSPKAYESLADKKTEHSVDKSRFRAHIGDAVDASWERCMDARAAANAGGGGQQYYPPGMCAAQQLVVLAMDHQCRPIGLTERWYKNGSPDAVPAGTLMVRDMVDGSPGPEREIAPQEMGAGKAVPPCGTCQVMLAALMCSEDAFLECEERTPKPGVCKCS